MRMLRVPWECLSPLGSGWKDKHPSSQPGVWVFVLALNPAAVLWHVAQGVCRHVAWEPIPTCCPPFLKSRFIFLERDAKPGCGWPSRDSIWEVKGFLAFPLAETSPAAVSLLPVLSVLNPSPFPPWPSSWAWSCSSGELRDGKFFFSLILNGHKTKLSLVLKRWCQVNSDKYWKTVALSTCLIFLLLPLLQQMKQVSKESIACIFSPETLAVKRLTEISQHNWTTIQFS